MTLNKLGHYQKLRVMDPVLKGHGVQRSKASTRRSAGPQDMQIRLLAAQGLARLAQAEDRVENS